MNVTPAPTQRKYDLDWLRVLAILMVFIYHSTRFFNLGDWHVKNPSTYFGVEVWNTFAVNWMMPLIFVISGASLFYGLEKGGAVKFFKDKVLRLLVPLLVGVFTHASLQVYLERLTHGQFSGSYFEFLPHYFDGLYLDIGEGGNFAWMGLHLWYLLVLFLFCLVFYPLLRWLKGAGKGALNTLGGFLAFPGAVYLLALPVILTSSAIGDTPLGELAPGGWSLVVYSCFFLSGFLIVSPEGLQASIRRLRWVSLGLGLVLMVVYLFLVINVDHPAINPVEDALGDPLSGLSAWCWILAFQGFAMQRLTFSTPFLKYANEAVLPFYILHQTVLLVVGYFVIRLDIPDLAKWLLVVLISFTIIIGLYERLVRRNNILRFLFGMKPVSNGLAPVSVASRLFRRGDQPARGDL